MDLGSYKNQIIHPRYVKMPLSLQYFLPIILICTSVALTRALTGFRYVDSSCNQYGGANAMNDGINEAIQACSKAATALNQPVNNQRVLRTFEVIFGRAPSPNEQQTVMGNPQTIYQTKSTKLSGSSAQSNIFVYCGHSLVWSTQKPDPSRSECVAQFDPVLNSSGAQCGVAVVHGDNTANDGTDIPGFWYAPNPYWAVGSNGQGQSGSLPTGFANPGQWVQLIGVTNGAQADPGQSYCASEPMSHLEASTIKSNINGAPSFILFCANSFIPPIDHLDWVTTNRNIQYWTTPGALGTTLESHQGSLSFHIMHEIGHAYDLCTVPYFSNLSA